MFGKVNRKKLWKFNKEVFEKHKPIGIGLKHRVKPTAVSGKNPISWFKKKRIRVVISDYNNYLEFRKFILNKKFKIHTYITSPFKAKRKWVSIVEAPAHYVKIFRKHKGIDNVQFIG